MITQNKFKIITGPLAGRIVWMMDDNWYSKTETRFTGCYHVRVALHDNDSQGHIIAYANLEPVK